MLTVSDLTKYSFCKRSLWLSKKAMIESCDMNWDSLVKYRVLRSVTNLVDSNKIHSLTDLMLQTLNKTNGKIVATEIYLKREGLCGRVDVIRQVDDSYVLQEEKTGDPPQGKIAWEDDLLQLDAYTFLAEGTKYSPVVSGIIIYNDLKPKKVKPNPIRAKEVLGEVIRR